MAINWKTFGALLLSSALATAMLVARVYVGFSGAYSHMLWNLGLAWIPYLCSLWAAHWAQVAPGRRWRLALPGTLWLLFFPNALYMVTCLEHLLVVPSSIVWYDITLMTSFAITGCVLAVVSLRIMQVVVQPVIGQFGSWLFVLGVAGLNGLGVYIGRYLRWNSWDVLFHPLAVAAEVAPKLIDPRSDPRALGVMMGFAALLLVCYGLWMTAPGVERRS